MNVGEYRGSQLPSDVENKGQLGDYPSKIQEAL